MMGQKVRSKQRWMKLRLKIATIRYGGPCKLPSVRGCQLRHSGSRAFAGYLIDKPAGHAWLTNGQQGNEARR